jgi:hypothetical protein
MKAAPRVLHLPPELPFDQLARKVLENEAIRRSRSDVPASLRRREAWVDLPDDFEGMKLYLCETAKKVLKAKAGGA